MRAGTHHVGRAAALFRRERAALALVLALASSGLLALTGCGADRQRGTTPNIVLVSIDSLRADRLGCYGADRDTSPAIDAIAAEGARFENAIASTSWTLPSHVSLFTGLSLAGHRVRRPEHRIDPKRHLLAEHLRGRGYRTAAFVSGPFLHRAYGFDRGFEVYENFQRAGDVVWPPPADALKGSHRDETAPQVLEAALSWLGERPLGDESPWFLFVHLWDVHYDFMPPPPYDTLFDADYTGDLDPTNFEGNTSIHADMAPRDIAWLKALYDGEIRWTDQHIARLLDALRAREGDERIMFVLVSDHGDEFFEHGEKGHYKQLFEESLRVPWLVRFPGVVPAGAVVGGVASLDDVAPTLLGLASLPPLPEAQGRDLSRLLVEGGAAEGEVLSELYTHSVLRGPGWKVLLDTKTGYAVHYDLEADPGEQDPQPARRVAPEKLERLTRRLRDDAKYADTLSWSGDAAVQLDEYTLQQLRALGYTE